MDNAPRCLTGWVVIPGHDPGVELDTLVDEWENRFFSIGCECGESTFTVRSYLGVHWYLRHDVAYGPLWLRCAACGRERESFNPSRHGYDAESAHFPPDDRYEGTPRDYACPKCTASAFTLTARFQYPDNATASFAELVARRGHNEPGTTEADLFTFFTLIGKCHSCGTLSTIATTETA